MFFDQNLKQVFEIELFQDLTIYSSFKCQKEILLFCPENECLIYLNLKTMEKKIILLEELSDWMFSPLYMWKQEYIILSDYKGEFAKVNLQSKKVNHIKIEDKEYQEIRKDIEKIKKFQIYKLYEKTKNALIYTQNSTMKLIDYNQDTKVIAEFERGKYFDFDYIDGYMVKVCEDNIEIIYNNQKFMYCSSEEYDFLNGKIMNLNGNKALFALSNLKSDPGNSSIERIELNKM